MKRFNVVIPKADGGVELHPMKHWLRQNPQHVPQGADPTGDTSHQLRGALKKRGWIVQEGESEVRLLMPGTATQGESIEAVLGESEEDDTAEETAFELEHQLRDFIAHNLATIMVGGRKLRVFVDRSGRNGVEYPTDVGPVDDEGSFVVFELKRANAPDKAVGQLLRYMGWVKAKIGEGRSVSGVIVAQSISDNLRYAALIVPNVQLFEYQVSFQLIPSSPLRVGQAAV